MARRAVCTWRACAALINPQGARSSQGHHPRMQMIQYSPTAVVSRWAAAYWMPPPEPVLGLAEGETRGRGMTGQMPRGSSLCDAPE
ncbi:hypothetical protein BRAS3843_2560005 [Bradyrhizobium sp. STM 3843]|nr:hypothetical protein BRAS3843_2560005 [Bradyrhizobium sp. STM 3843]